MSLTTSQVRCPFCNGAHAANAAGSYECEYCLQPFTVQDAQKEESRLTAEIEAWLQQRVGASGVSGGTVDASSRSYIFQNKMLPDIRRDVDRALEVLGDHAQHPLVELPVGAPSNGSSNPLLARRPEVMRFKDLQARLSSEQVTSFAMSPEDQSAVHSMDRRRAAARHLSNVVEACSGGATHGFAAARRNLGVLAEDIAEQLPAQTQADPAHGAFQAAMLERFRALSDLCEVYEAVTSPNAISGASLMDRLQGLHDRLLEARGQVEGSGHSPAETFPHMLGIQREAEGCSDVRRWLHAYDAIAGRSGVAFAGFVSEMEALFAAEGAHTMSEMVDACVDVVRAARGEIAVGVIDDFSWVGEWVERTREKRTLGLFGAEESADQVDEFFLPVWVADVSFSKSSGAVFKEGVESSRVALVDACGPTSQKAVILEEQSPVANALTAERQLAGRATALPRGTPGAAEAAFKAAAAASPTLLNPKLKVQGIRFVAAAVATLSSKKGSRQVAA